MGRGVFSPVYVDDLVDGVLRAATHDAGSGQVFTIGGGVGVTCREFFAHYYRMLGKSGPPVLPTPVALALTSAAAGVARATRTDSEINPVAVRYFTRRGTYSIAKARRLLAYEPAVDLADGHVAHRGVAESRGPGATAAPVTRTPHGDGGAGWW